MPFVKGIGPFELIIILVVVMIIFGVGRLPEVGGAMGKAIREFRKSQTPSEEGTEVDEETKKEEEMSASKSES